MHVRQGQFPVAAVAEVKQGGRAAHHREHRPAVCSLGETLAIYWGGTGRLHMFCAVPAWFRFVR